MRNFVLLTLFASSCSLLSAYTLTSPDQKLQVNVDCQNNQAQYSVQFNQKSVILDSPLGLVANVGNYAEGLQLTKASEIELIKDDYTLANIKRSQNHYEANRQIFTFSKGDKPVMNVEFEVSNNNIAFRYQILPVKRDTKCCVIEKEATSFKMAEQATTFLCPQMGEMTGFARTAPSYETHYDADAPMGKNGWGHGYTFPCLFHVDANLWALISETGVDGNYVASKLENRGGNLYEVSFPSPKENNGYGTSSAQVALPSYTPWRTITVGETLKPIVESTITWDVLHGLQPKQPTEKYGRGAWSWIIAGDGSCKYDVQKQYIDFAAEMGWESLLIDAFWDAQIGRDKIAELATYGKGKGVNLYLWYNSNGVWNDAPQSPLNCMDRSYRRRAEMKWMQSVGIRGIKVDFFGGDKQCTMQLYEDILRDAEEFGLMVIFHGCTLPRGWERMYSNFAACEAVRASENLHFSQGECDREAMDATFLPFIRNAVGSMDFGGSTLNWYYNGGNNRGSRRVTSNVFALATAILFQSPVQHFAMAPNNLTDAPDWALDFMKKVPTSWDEVRFIDGYPGKYVVLARRTGDKWYITGINAQAEPLQLKLDLSMFGAGTELKVYSEDMKLSKGKVTPEGGVKTIKNNKKQTLAVTIPNNGGLVICQ